MQEQPEYSARVVVYTPHYLLQFGGTLGTATTEIWSCGIRMHSGDYTGFDEDGYFTSVAWPALAAWMARSGSKISSSCKLAYAKFNLINAAGHYDDTGNTREYVWPTPVPGVGANFGLPYQSSVVLGWRTDAASRGRASKGRIYSPMPCVTPIQSTGVFATADAQAMATSAADLLNTLDYGWGGAGTIRPHIMSGVDGSFNEINTVVVDNRIDIQRRRANSLVATTMSAPVTY